MPLTALLCRLFSWLEARITLLALLFCAASSGFWMIALAKRCLYYSNEYMYWDQSFHAQTLWAILHGSINPSFINAPFTVDHCFFLSFLLAPFYALWPDPLFLPYVKIAILFSGAFILFITLKKHLNPWVALGAMMAFTIAPANISLLFSVFNYEPFSIPLVLLIFKAMDDDNYIMYIICCCILAMVKEQMPLAVMMFGALALLAKKDKVKWGWVPLIAGFSIFIIEIFILVPFVRRHLPYSSGYFWGRYAQFGHAPVEIFFSLLSHPLKALQQFVLPWNVRWYNDLFGAWGVLSFLSPHILLPASLLFIKTILSLDHLEHEASGGVWYAATFTPFIFLATWNTLNHVRGRWRLPAHFLALTAMFAHGFIFLPQKLSMINPPITSNDLARQRILEKIPPQASVLSALPTLVPLENREKIYPLVNYINGFYVMSLKKFVLPQDTQYLLLDFVDDDSANENTRDSIYRLYWLNFNDRWSLQESIEDIALYAQTPAGHNPSRLVERSSVPWLPRINVSRTFDHTLRLNGLDFPAVFPSKYRIFPLTMYWQCARKTHTFYKILIRISSLDDKTYYSKTKPVGSIIYPAYLWRHGEYIKESYFCLLPRMPNGNYVISIAVYNPALKKWVGKNEQHFIIS